MLELLLVLLGLAFPVMAVFALVTALGARTRLNLLQARIMALESGAPAASPVPAPAVAPAPPAPAAPAAIATSKKAETPPASAPPGTPPSPPPKQETIGFEQRFGTQWVVWVGGLALALGGIFLVRYSIEQGLIGPGVRIMLAALLALALIAAGEWARRKEIATGIAGIPRQHIPSILTAAGTVVAYATVYGAFALYGFLPAAAAFVLLGVVALATLAAALLHGPALAGLGLVGAFVTPLLIATKEPNYWALYLYLAVVTAAAFALARLRMWKWLAITAAVIAALWALAGLGGAIDGLAARLFHVVAGYALAAALIVAGVLYGPPAAAGEIDRVSSGVLGAYLIAAALLAIAGIDDLPALTVFALLCAATVGIAWRSDAAVAVVPAAAVLAAVVMLHWMAGPIFNGNILPAGPVAGAIPEPARAAVGLHLAFGAFYAVLFGLSGFFAQGRSEKPLAPILWAAAAAFAPLAILIALYYRVAEFERSIPFAALALLLAALYAVAAETLIKRPPRPGLAAGTAIFATGAVASLALTLTFALEKGWLTVGLALMVPGIAWIAQQRPLPFLRQLAAIIVVLVTLRIGYEPRIVGDDIGSTPVFNWLLYGYGAPAAAFWTAGYLLRQRADDVPARMTDAAAILFTVLLAFLEIRHFMNQGNVFRDSAGLGEIALQVSTGLALTIGLERLRERSGSIVHDIGALVVAALTLSATVIGLAMVENPLFTGRPVGGLFMNLVLLGYGLPAVLAAILALTARHSRPIAYRYVAATTAVGLAIAYLSLEIRTLFHGPVLKYGPASYAEQYTYSAVWLGFGVALLMSGLLLRSQPARMASAAVVMLTIAKVFLVDMAGLAGIYRALSFIGLGLVLVGIGWLYQRVLFPARQAGGPNE